MAERRMFAKTIIDSDAFLDMPLSTQALYFHLSMRADDEGFVNNVKKIMRMVGASQDEINVLIGKRFILVFESGIIVIKHWKLHNYIRKDRLSKTKYTDEKKQMVIKENDVYSFKTDKCLTDVRQVTAEVRLGKVRLGKVKEDKKKDKKKIAFPTENELHTIFFDELSKRLEKLKLNPASIDKTKAENIFLLFYDYALKYKSTKKAYKDYNSASRTWIGNSLTKMKDFDYDGTMISPQVSNKTPEEIAEDKKKIHDMVIRNKDK